MIPSNVYENPPPAKGNNYLRYSNFSASLDALQAVKYHLGVSPYRLGILLGMKHPGNTYTWFQGRSRPSQAYCVKIIKLITLAAFEGLRLPFVESIDWDTGEIVLKGGVKDQGHNRAPQRKRTSPENQSGYSVPGAEFLD